MDNTQVFPQPTTRWSVVFVEQTLPDGNSHQGRVQAYDSAIYIADVALYLKAIQPQLGIQDPYELNSPQYQAALMLLRSKHRLIHRYWHDDHRDWACHLFVL